MRTIEIKPIEFQELYDMGIVDLLPVCKNPIEMNSLTDEIDRIANFSDLSAFNLEYTKAEFDRVDKIFFWFIKYFL